MRTSLENVRPRSNFNSCFDHDLVYYDMVRLMAIISYYGIHPQVFQHNLSKFWVIEFVLIEFESYPFAHNKGKRVDKYLLCGDLMDSLQGSPVLDAGEMQISFVLLI